MTTPATRPLTQKELAAELNRRLIVWSFYKWGFWFRILGRGISVAKSPPRFSERYGYVKTIRLGRWRLQYLPKIKMKNKSEAIFICQPPGVGVPSDARPEINLQETTTGGKPDDQVICCGYVPVVLMKMFGPLVFADIRIRAEHSTCEWIIDRQAPDEDERDWIEVFRVPGQMEGDFSE